MSLDGDELFSDGEEDEDDERESHLSTYSSPSAQPSPSEKARLRNERRRRRSQLEMDRRTAGSHSQSPHEIHKLSNHNHRTRHSFSSSSSPHFSSSQPHSRRPSTLTAASQPSPAAVDQPLHDAHIATLLLPLSTSLPLPTLHSRLSSLRSALHASHRQLTEYRSLLSDKQLEQTDEKQINYELFMKVKEQDEHIQWLTHSLKQANINHGTATPTTDGGETERLTLRGMRGVALHAAHMQLREMMGEVDKRANEIRRLEEQVRTLRIEKEARIEGDSNEIERLRQEVAVLMGKLAVETEEREQRDRERSRQERKMEKQLEKLRQQRQSLEHDLLQSSAEVNTLSSALSSLRSQHSTLTFDHQRILDEKLKVEQEREGWRKRYEDVMDEVDTMRSELRDAREVSDGIGRLVEGSESLDMRRVRDECERKVVAMQEEVRAMERAVMDTKRGMDAEVEARVQQLTAALHEELQQLRAERTKQIEQWMADVATARHEQEEAEADNEQLRQRLQRLTQQLERANDANIAASRPSQPTPPVSAEEQNDDTAGNNSVDPSLLAVLRAELDSVRAINQRLIAAQQQADSSARSQLDAARQDMERKLQESERKQQELHDEVNRLQGQLEAHRQHKLVDEEQKQRQDESKDSAFTDSFQQREQQWQHERSQMLQSLTALTAESNEREAVAGQLMDKITVLEDNARRAARVLEREKAVPPAAASVTLSTSVNEYSASRSPHRPASAMQSQLAAPSDGVDIVPRAAVPSARPFTPSTPVSTKLSSRPVPLSPAAGELLSDSLLDQLASRLAAKLTHTNPTAAPPTRPTPPRFTTSPSPVRTRPAHDVNDDHRASSTARAATSADIAAEMAAIYRQLEGKSRTFSHFAQTSAGSDRTTIRLTSNNARTDRRVPAGGRLAADEDELKEVEQDDYIPLIRRTVGGHAPHAKPITRHSAAASMQQQPVQHTREATAAARVSPSSYVHSPTSSLASSASSSSPTASSHSSSARQPHLTSPPLSPCSLSPSLSSSAASSVALSPVVSAVRVSTGSRVVYGGSVRLQQQQRRTSSRTR